MYDVEKLYETWAETHDENYKASYIQLLENLLIESIPKPKFKKGDIVVTGDGIEYQIEWITWLDHWTYWNDGLTTWDCKHYDNDTFAYAEEHLELKKND